MAIVGMALCVSPALAVDGARAVARELLDKVAEAVTAEPATSALVAPFTSAADAALSRADEGGADLPERHRALLEDLALEWAQVAGDLLLARNAEHEADRLERELSEVQTELVRSRAAVEQAQARVGRARADVAARGEVGSPGNPEPADQPVPGGEQAP